MKVVIPTGTYRPEISWRPDSLSKTSDTPQRAPPIVTDDPKARLYWFAPLLGLVGFVVLTAVVVGIWLQQRDQPNLREAAIRVQIVSTESSSSSETIVASAISRALSSSAAIQVIDRTLVETPAGAADFQVTLRAIAQSQANLVLIELLDTSDGSLVWASDIRVEPGSDFSAMLENQIIRELRVRLYGASKQRLERLDPNDLSPEALFVLATWVPGVAISSLEWEQSRLEYARLALLADPDFGAAHSVLADKLSYLANIYALMDTQELRQEAELHGFRALELAPLDPDVLFNIAQSLWHSGRISESQAMLARVVQLDPTHNLARFLERVVPFTCAAAPVAVLQDAIAFDENLSADNPIRWLTQTWVGWLHAYRREWDQALAAEEAAARIFQIPYTFMRRAMILNQLGRTSEATALIDQQSLNWTHFDTELRCP